MSNDLSSIHLLTIWEAASKRLGLKFIKKSDKINYNRIKVVFHEMLREKRIRNGPMYGYEKKEQYYMMASGKW
jgi:hypothetical protein